MASEAAWPLLRVARYTSLWIVLGLLPPPARRQSRAAEMIDFRFIFAHNSDIYTRSGEPGHPVSEVCFY
jgi:hypothetical protein